MDDDRLHEDTLFLACTRPAMIGGVTMEAMGLNLMATCIIFILAGNIFYAVIGVVIHYICKGICKLDHNMFRILFAFLETKARARNRPFWGGSSCTPLKLIRKYEEKELTVA